METNYYNQKTLDEAAQLILAGELVAFPTETVYGLGADATNEGAVKKVYWAKGRPSDNPLIVHVKSQEDVLMFVDNLSRKAQKLMTHFWPGPLTMVFEIKKGSLPMAVTGGLSTAAFRMPNNKLTLDLIAKAGVPLVGPSANTSGKPSPTTGAHVYHDLVGKIAGILDDGPTELGLESTVLDLTGEIPVILRPGFITQKDLEKVCGEVLIDQHLVSANEAPKAPGMKYQHYSPNAKVLLIDWQKNNWSEALSWAEEKGLNSALLASQEIIENFRQEKTRTYSLSIQADIHSASKQLFAGLRALDEETMAVDVIFAQTYPEEGAGLAYMNRLKKAANQLFFDEE